MKKRNEFDEFLRLLEEAIDGMIDEMNLPEDKPVNIEISINLCPHMFFDYGFAKPTKNPVDILETERSIHAVIGIPDMEMESIRLTGKGKVLEITALSGDNAIDEKIELPARVNKTFKTTYKNGILEVVLNKPKTTRGR